MLIFQHDMFPSEFFMPRMIGSGLSRREREILDALHRLERATVGDIQTALADPPSYSAVRSLVRILEDKGHARHEEDGKRYIYLPTQPRGQAAKNALHNVVQTFFGGSLESAVKSFLSTDDAQLSDDELERMAGWIETARREREKGSSQ